MPDRPESPAAQGRDVAVRPPSWEIKRKTGPGTYQTYAYGYFAPIWSVTLFFRSGARTIIGRKRIARSWSRV